MHWSNRQAGTCFLCLSVLLLALISYPAFDAECVFNGKSSGTMEAMSISDRYPMLSLGALLASFVCAFAGIYMLAHRQIQPALAAFLLLLTFGVPLTIVLSIEASVRGSQSCTLS